MWNSVFKWTLRFGEYTDFSLARESEIFIVLGIAENSEKHLHFQGWKLVDTN